MGSWNYAAMAPNSAFPSNPAPFVAPNLGLTVSWDSALDLDGTTVCVTGGTTTESNMADFFRQNNMSFEALIFEDTATVYDVYEQGRCDVTTSDKSQLAAVRSGFADSDAHILLPQDD